MAHGRALGEDRVWDGPWVQWEVSFSPGIDGHAAFCALGGMLERFPITWNHVIGKESLKFKELEHVLAEKVEQLFRDML
jgi:hypothetical protein